MVKALDVANYFLSLVDEDAGDSLSNLKLQKLVYYAQGCHLALFGTPLFKERIEAWAHGPVVPELYHRFKPYGAGPIPRPARGVDRSKYTKRVRELLDEVFDVYGQFSASKLRSMTHEEPPWAQAYGSAPSTAVSHDSMQSYFKTQVNG